MPHDPTTHRRHQAGDHGGCRPSWCLAARTDHGSPPAEGTQPTSTPDFPDGYEPRCSVCETSIEHIPTHPDGRPGGWRHTTDHGQEAHTAHPGGGDRS